MSKSKLHTLMVQTAIGDFTVAALPNAQNQLIWQVIEVPAQFKAIMTAAGLELSDLVLNAVQGDESGREAMRLLKTTLPVSEVKDRISAGMIGLPSLNHKKFASRKSVADSMVKFQTVINTKTGKSVRIYRKQSE